MVDQRFGQRPVVQLDRPWCPVRALTPRHGRLNHKTVDYSAHATPHVSTYIVGQLTCPWSASIGRSRKLLDENATCEAKSEDCRAFHVCTQPVHAIGITTISYIQLHSLHDNTQQPCPVSRLRSADNSNRSGAMLVEQASTPHRMTIARDAAKIAPPAAWLE